MNSEVAKEQLDSTDPWRRGVTRNVGDSVLYHALRRQAPSRLLRHLSEKPVLRQVAEAVNHCELLDECFALKSTCRDLVGEGIATLILVMVGITS